MDPWLRETAARQHGILQRAQLRRHLSAKQVERWLTTGRLEPLWPAVYRVAGAPPSWEQELHGACLAGGAGVAASHRSAARLWGLSGVPAERVEVSAGSGRAVRLSGVVAHRSNLLDPGFVAELDGIPVTTAERTLVDLSAVVGLGTLARALDDGVRRGIVTYGSVEGCLDLMRRRGRRRTTMVDQLLEERQGLDPGESHLEARVARWLVAAGLPRPVAQWWVVAGGRRYRIDLAYPDLGVGFELDGWEAHGSRNGFEGDRRRGNDLALHGWRIYHFTSRTARETVVRVASAALSVPA
jgi:hypothetical protein